MNANGFVRTVDFTDSLSGKIVAAPLQFDEDTPPLTRAPNHGEHTDDALKELGLSMDEILDLKIKGAVL